MPKNQEITSNKIYSDILYGYLQEVSFKEDNNRYLTKEQVNNNNVSTILQISRPTVGKKLNNLIELGLLLPSKNPKYKYELPPMLPQDAFLIPQETLRIMVNSLTSNAISIYTINLLDRYIYLLH